MLKKLVEDVKGMTQVLVDPNQSRLTMVDCVDLDKLGIKQATKQSVRLRAMT